MENTDISYPVAKILSAWAFLGVTTWQDAAAFAAFLYSVALLGEWVFKRLWLGWGRDYWLSWRDRGRDDAS